jgi:hypothetical protein
LCTAQLFGESPVALANDSLFDVPNRCGNVIVLLQRIGVLPILHGG